MHKIRTYNNISSQGLDKFPHDSYEVASELPDPDAFLLRSQTLHEVEFPPTLKAIARAGAGVNNVPVERCSEKGIVVFNAPGANANAVKELVLAGMLLSARDIYQGICYVDGLRPQEGLDPLLEKEKKRFAGTELCGKTLGVVGLGNIGALVANMGLSLGMKVCGYDPAISVQSAWRLSSNVQKMDNLSSLFARCDYISLHLPAIDTTLRLINSALLGCVKPNTVLLNFARGEIVNKHDVISALDTNRLHRYICDFPSNETLGHPKILQMPHIGASTQEAEDNCAIMVADQLIDFLENGNICNSVNFPQIGLPRSTPVRITLTNSNVPRVLGQITAIIAEYNLNIVDMLNKSRNDLAYTIIDLEERPCDASIQALNNIEEVINLRVISHG
ncbi:MAG: D-3-phosphoglycerate dehydrogenase [Motiliproteus sp.]|jgi:D-3-phosphoglycerate dehydrogenase